MKTSKIPGLTFKRFAVGFILVVAVCLVIDAVHQPSSTPLIKIGVLDYTNITFSSSNAVFPGTWIIAHVVLTNEGTASVSYSSYDDSPYGWVKATASSGLVLTTNGNLAPPFTGAWTLVRPNSSVTFLAWLPAGTSKWQFGFPVHVSSTRQYVQNAMLDTPWLAKRLDRLPDWVFEWTIGLLPDKTGPDKDFKSEELEVDTNAVNKSLHP